MSTITATKHVSIDTLSELLNAIKTYGKDNVSADNMYELFRASINNINTAEWYELIEIGSDDLVASTISELFAHNHFRTPFVNAFGVTEEEFTSRLINIALDRDIHLSRVPPCTTLEQINALAERDLVSLYFVEHVESIDLDFVRKYADGLDLGAVARHSNKQDVREFAQELYYN